MFPRHFYVILYDKLQKKFFLFSYDRRIHKCRKHSVYTTNNAEKLRSLGVNDKDRSSIMADIHGS